MSEIEQAVELLAWEDDETGLSLYVEDGCLHVTFLFADPEGRQAQAIQNYIEKFLAPELLSCRAGGWVSVSERLPRRMSIDLSDPVLGCFPDGEVVECRYDHDTGLWITPGGGCGDAITHWQPLPSPPPEAGE